MDDRVRRERVDPKWKEYEKRYLMEMAADPKDPRHGTSTGYMYGCRCDRCRAAGGRYTRVRAKRQMEAEAKAIREGLKAYKRWLAMGGTPESWREWHPVRGVTE